MRSLVVPAMAFPAFAMVGPERTIGGSRQPGGGSLAPAKREKPGQVPGPFDSLLLVRRGG